MGREEEMGIREEGRQEHMYRCRRAKQAPGKQGAVCRTGADGPEEGRERMRSLLWQGPQITLLPPTTVPLGMRAAL